MLVALLGQWLPLLVSGRFPKCTGQPAVALRIFDRSETLRRPRLQGPAQCQDRPHSVDGPQRGHSLLQPWMLLQHSNQALVDLRQALDLLAAKSEKRFQFLVDPAAVPHQLAEIALAV